LLDAETTRYYLKNIPTLVYFSRGGRYGPLVRSTKVGDGRSGLDHKKTTGTTFHFPVSSSCPQPANPEVVSALMKEIMMREWTSLGMAWLMWMLRMSRFEKQ
jgi:hypothetical protein